MIIETAFGNVGGMFSAEELPVFNGLKLEVICNPQSVVPQVVEVLAADIDQDGDVDAQDFLIV